MPIEDIQFVPLTQGKFAIIDAEDAERILERRWQVHRSRNKCYAISSRRRTSTVLMHRVILQPPAGVLIDHIDGDGLNNRRSNLRLSTVSQNCFHAGLRRNNTSGFIGVDRNGSGWSARLRCGRTTHHIGTFRTAEEAARARDAAALELFGEFAVLNFPT